MCLSLLLQKEDGSACTEHKIPNLPSPRKNADMVVQGRTKVFLGGGKEGSDTASLLMFDLEQPALGWQAKQPLTRAMWIPQLVSHGDKILMLGGRGVRAVEEYDVAADA